MIKGVYPCPRRSIGTRIYIGPGQARDSLHFSFPDNPLSMFCHQDHSEKKTTRIWVVSSQLLNYEQGCLFWCPCGSPFAALDGLQGEVAVTKLIDAVDLHVKLVVMPLLVGYQTLEDDLGRSVIVR